MKEITSDELEAIAGQSNEALARFSATMLCYIVNTLAEIANSLDRSANASEATHALYKKANNQTVRAMEAREERERESAQRDREQHQMNKERHDAFMATEKARLAREEKWAVQIAAAEEKSKGVIQNVN